MKPYLTLNFDVCDVQVGQLGYWDKIGPDQLVTGIPS